MSDAVDIRAGRLPPDAYAANFDDLHPPLDHPQALVDASRCYFCHDAPCIEACPTAIDIPAFIRGIQTGNMKGAALAILEANIMGGACARVCPTEVLCERACVRTAQEGKPVRIGMLQRHATDWLFEQDLQPFNRAPATGRRVAVVGAGPAGLACAHALARHGHDVTVFEKRPKGGGLNEYGIAAYKVPHGFAAREVEFITALGGIEIRYDTCLGRDLTLDGLARDHDAVFVGVGLQGVNELGLPGEDLDGVVDAVAYIERLRQSTDPAGLPVGRDVVVVGGGNTAVDIAIQTRRLGAETVTIAYRRGAEQMGATAYEQELAQVNGVRLLHWVRPVRLLGEDGRVRGIELERTRVGDAGRLEGTGQNLTLRADQVFKAIGQLLAPASLDGGAQTLALSGAKLKVDDERRTSLPGIWAGGDAIAHEQDLTVVAVEDGKRAAASIHAFLTSL